MQTVFIVTAGCYSDYHIEAVFSNREAAEKYIKAFKDCDYDYFPTDIGIEEYELKEDFTKDILTCRAYKVMVYRNKKGEFDERAICYFDERLPEEPIGWRDFYDQKYQHACLQARKGETKEKFLERARKIIIDEWYIWKRRKQEELTMINSKQED